MKWANNGGGGNFQNPEPGTYAATCSKLIDLGTQENKWGDEVKLQRKVFVAWEINETMEDGKPFQVSAFLTQSMHEKSTLRKYLENWRGSAFTDEEIENFNPASLLGKSCMVTLSKNEKGKVNVTGVSKLMKGVEGPKLSIEPVYFSLDAYDADVYSKLGQGIQNMIAKSPEFEKVGAEDIPFGVE